MEGMEPGPKGGQGMKDDPRVEVAAAIVRRGGLFLVQKRPPGSHLEGAWEFPGGRIRRGEAPAAAARRECGEEVGLSIRETILLHVEEHAYPDRAVRIHFFLCMDAEGEPSSREGHEFRWASLADLESLETPAANRTAIRLLREQFEET
jgi:8-oxo-dGTP diphosphatase